MRARSDSPGLIGTCAANVRYRAVRCDTMAARIIWWEGARVDRALDKVVGDKRFYALAALYGSFCFWRVFVGATIDRLGDLWSGLLGAATYLAFAAAVVSTNVYVPISTRLAPA